MILERNRNHFSKAKNSPWNVPLLNNINKDNDYNLETTQGIPIQLPETSTEETLTVLELLKTLTKKIIHNGHQILRLNNSSLA